MFCHCLRPRDSQFGLLIPEPGHWIFIWPSFILRKCWPNSIIWSHSTLIENRLQHRVTSNSHKRGLKPNKTHYDMNIFKEFWNLFPLPQLSLQQGHVLLSHGPETNVLNFSSKTIQYLLRIRILTKNKDWVIQDSRSLSRCDKCNISFILFQD